MDLKDKIEALRRNIDSYGRAQDDKNRAQWLEMEKKINNLVFEYDIPSSIIKELRELNFKATPLTYPKKGI